MIVDPELIAAYRQVFGDWGTLTDDEVAERVEQIATGMTRAVESLGQAIAEMGKRMQVAFAPVAELAIDDGE